jgi:acetylornithine deacetylase/succinyl-diaminopimelate desuccinylase-like protein
MYHEAVDLLSRYIRIDTSVPPGNEAPAVDFLAGLFRHEGIFYKTYEAGPQRQSIRAVLRGSGKKGPVILLNHIDVVPADKSEWTVDPFGGEIRDGFVYGRGALDMKGQGILELMAFLAMKRQGIALSRDLIFLAVADEEAMGVKGVQFLLEQYPDDLKADLVINEGGFGITGIIPGKPLILISPAEKGICWLKLKSKGRSGHGSMPHEANALEILIKAVNRLLSMPSPPIVTPDTAEYFKCIAHSFDFMKPYLDDGKEETLIKVLTESGMLRVPQFSAMLKNTVSVNMLHSGSKVNVIPSQAEAEVDIRLLPGYDTHAMTERVKEALQDEHIEVIYQTGHNPNGSSKDTEHYRIMEEVMQRHFPAGIVAPLLMLGSSDSRFFREKGVPSYGFMPVILPLTDIGLIHGIDERISIDNLIRGSEIMTDLVLRLCGDP